MEPPDLPDQQQLDELAKRLHPLLRKLAGAAPGQDLQIQFSAVPTTDPVNQVILRLELKLDGKNLPPEQEAKIDLFFRTVIDRSGVTIEGCPPSE